MIRVGIMMVLLVQRRSPRLRQRSPSCAREAIRAALADGGVHTNPGVLGMGRCLRHESGGDLVRWVMDISHPSSSLAAAALAQSEVGMYPSATRSSGVVKRIYSRPTGRSVPEPRTAHVTISDGHCCLLLSMKVC